MPDIFIQTFSELTPALLYDILKLRQDVFIIEQNCPYEDLDNLDQDALHLVLYENKRLVACCRILSSHPKHGSPSAGRFVVHPEKRGKGCGKMMIMEALRILKSQGQQHAVIEAQEHLEQYYSTYGFRKASEVYDADGIPHIKMKINLH